MTTNTDDVDKWEYQEIDYEYVDTGFSSPSEKRVKFVNNQSAKRLDPSGSTGILGRPKESFPHLWEYLNMIGQQGWEVITLSSAGTGRSGTLIAKRKIAPKQ